MKEWLLTCYEEGDLTKQDLRAALVNSGLARELWVEFCDNDQFVEECRYQIEDFLKELEEVES